MGFGAPKMPAVPAAAPPPPLPPPLPPAAATASKTATLQANAKAAGGVQGTILTSPTGTSGTDFAGKTLLGE